MEEKTNTLELLYENVEQFSKTSIELYRLKAIGKAAELISGLASGFAVIVFASVFFLVFNIGLALYLGEITGKMYYGFFIVSGFYLLLGLIVHLFRRQLIETPVSESIISIALK